jgi:xylitol oxidase
MTDAVTDAALRNWAGNVTYAAQRLSRPSSIAELQAVVAGSSRVRALGTRHSFSPIADTIGDLVSVAGLPPMIGIDTERRQARVAAGLRYGEVTGAIHAAGLALPNLGSLPHISIAGACATGTHGSGPSLGSLATAVSALEMITASGDLVTVSRAQDPADFPGTVVALGSLGIITSLTLDLEPTFDVAQVVYEGLERDTLDEHFDAIFASAYSVSLYTDWQTSRIDQAWVRRRVDVDQPPAPTEAWFGASPAERPLHPVAGMDASSCTDQLGIPGPWHARLPAFRLEFTPSAGDELQSEYLLPRDRALDALAALDGLAGRIAPVLHVSEIRTVAADDLWLSPAYGRPTVALHFTWRPDRRAVEPVIADVEAELTPMGARPHWGKIFGTATDDVRGQYDRLGDFNRLMQHYDPSGKLGNAMVDRYVRLA